MRRRNAPPARRSISSVSQWVMPSGPIQSRRIAGSVHARQTRPREAGRMRVISSDVDGWVRGCEAKARRRSLFIRSSPVFIGQSAREFVEAALPESGVVVEPGRAATECGAVQFNAFALALPGTQDQFGVLENAQMPRDRRKRNCERRRQFV